MDIKKKSSLRKKNIFIPEDPAKMPQDQRSTQKVFRGLCPGEFVQKHRDKISHKNRSITQTSHIEINFSDLFGLWVGPYMGFYHNAFAGMPRETLCVLLWSRGIFTGSSGI